MIPAKTSILRKELLSERDGNYNMNITSSTPRTYLRKELLSERDGNNIMPMPSFAISIVP